MRIQLSESREDGAVAVIVALFAVTLIVVAAFTTDFGMAYAQRQAFATGADSAALAVARAQYKTQLAQPTRTCSDAVIQDAALAATDVRKALVISLAQVNANAPFNATIPASDVTTTLSCVSGTPPTVKILQVEVVVSRTISPILGDVLGASPIHVERTAVAALGVINEVRGLSPLALCTEQADAIRAVHALDLEAEVSDRAQIVPVTSKVWKSPGCGTDGSGNRGWLTYPGQGGGANGLGDMIESGYSGAITLNPAVPPSTRPSTLIGGEPGVKASVRDSMKKLMDFDKPVTLPVYSTVTTNGSNATYTVIGFLSVKICGWDLDKFGPCYDPGVPMMEKEDMQVRYAGYTPAGQIGTVCGLGDPCAASSYHLTKLLR